MSIISIILYTIPPDKKLASEYIEYFVDDLLIKHPGFMNRVGDSNSADLSQHQHYVTVTTEG